MLLLAICGCSVHGDGSIRVKEVADLRSAASGGKWNWNTKYYLHGQCGPNNDEDYSSMQVAAVRAFIYTSGDHAFSSKYLPRLVFPRRMNYLPVELVPECSLHGGRTRQRKI